MVKKITGRARSVPPCHSEFGIVTSVTAVIIFALVLCSLKRSLAQSSPAQQNVFAHNGSGVSFPIELSEGEIIVPVSIGGSPPLRFVLDSGSTRTLIDRGLATTLGLKEGQISSLQGAGQGRIPIRALRNVDLHLPGLDTKDYDCFSIDLTPADKAVGTKEDGILGYDFFERFVITVDFTSRRMTLELPSSFSPPAGFESLPLELRNKWVFVSGELRFPNMAPVTDKFFIDSGSSDAVDHPIVREIQSRRSTTTGVGLGTPMSGSLAVATSFRIGNFTVKSPIVACCGATDATNRMIGTEVLRRFTVIFDYSSSRLFLKPNDALNEPFGVLPHDR